MGRELFSIDRNPSVIFLNSCLAAYFLTDTIFDLHLTKSPGGTYILMNMTMVVWGGPWMIADKLRKVSRIKYRIVRVPLCIAMVILMGGLILSVLPVLFTKIDDLTESMWTKAFVLLVFTWNINWLYGEIDAYFEYRFERKNAKTRQLSSQI